MKTNKGAFPEVYHHIDAPTYSDEDFFAKYHKRKLINPLDWDKPDGKTVSVFDAFRTIPLMYLSEADWCYKRKLDGENQRIKWDGEQALWNGKSDRFSCSNEWEEYMNDTFAEEVFEEKFGRDKVVFLFGERMGSKVQGNELNLTGTEFVLFDVCINGFYLGQDAIIEVARAFGIRSCFDFMYGGDQMYIGSLVQLIQECADGKYRDWEGIVATPHIELRDQGGHRIITKIKTRDYYVQP